LIELGIIHESEHDLYKLPPGMDFKELWSKCSQPSNAGLTGPAGVAPYK
jgi:hypothetical protein